MTARVSLRARRPASAETTPVAAGRHETPLVAVPPSQLGAWALGRSVFVVGPSVRGDELAFAGGVSDVTQYAPGDDFEPCIGGVARVIAPFTVVYVGGRRQVVTDQVRVLLVPPPAALAAVT